MTVLFDMYALWPIRV